MTKPNIKWTILPHHQQRSKTPEDESLCWGNQQVVLLQNLPSGSGTCVESGVPLSMKPSVQPVATATTDSVSSPFCLKKESRRCLRVRRLFRRAHMLLLPPGPGPSPGPGPCEPRSERNSSSSLGSSSSSISAPAFRWCVQPLAADGPGGGAPGGLSSSWRINSSWRSGPSVCRRT